MGKLTAKKVEHLPPEEKEYREADGDGLYLRIRPSGAKSWLFCYRLGSNRRWLQMTLGSTKSLSLKEAREQIKELRKLVAEGIDPRNARAAIKAENTNAITMQSLFNSWIEFLKIAGEVTPKWIKRHEDRWRIHLKAPLGNILTRDINRSHLAAALDEMTRKGIREETRKALTTLNLMLDYALTRHFIDHNPARVLKPKDFAATASKPRDRVLSINELRLLWQALEQSNEENKSNDIAKMSVITAYAIKLLILTGARRSEIAGMRWEEINLTSKEWKLPSDRTKNRQSHTIYLSELAIRLVLQLKEITGNSPFVFDTGRYEDGGHIHQDSLTGAIARLRGSSNGSRKKVLKHAPLEDLKPFTIHDIRRSAATAWGEYLKTPPHVIERMLNHQPVNKLIATYQRATYANEQQWTWKKWGEIVESQVIGNINNVISIKSVASA